MGEDLIGKVAAAMKVSHNTVVVTGAGISTEAGIPDFRGQNGIYRQLGENRVMNIINIDFFYSQPQQFYQFYRKYFCFPPTQPSKAHYLLAEMESKGLIKGIVTQNIDNLHQRAGSKAVVAIHGNADRYVCTGANCRRQVNGEYVNEYPDIVPLCPNCGSVIKPDVVLFGENIKNYIGAREMILKSRLLVVIGSSLTVYPLAGFVKEFSTFTQDLVIINKGYTGLDHAALVKLEVGEGSTGDILEEILSRL
ncbi:MAG TPA: Sir2 family NAD-dependent protein deacetylase [Syntrophomonadaceae bacterium]|nr:Sir2 family NAD-dependent protein deacetylase [Syntrophomonadaceae bacterium]